MKIIKDMQHRPFSLGEGIRGMRPEKAIKAQPTLFGKVDKVQTLRKC